MMMKSVCLFLSAWSLVVGAAPLLRRTRHVVRSENVVRGIDPKDEGTAAARALRDEADVRMMVMSLDNGHSMVEPSRGMSIVIPSQGMSMDGGMSMPQPGALSGDGTMSMPPPCSGDMSMPIYPDTAFPLDGMSYPYDGSDMMSVPLDDSALSMPYDDSAYMSMPDESAMSYDVTMSLPYTYSADTDNDVCDEDIHQVATVTQSFEVDTSNGNPVGILSDALVTAIEAAGFPLCPASSARRQLVRKLDESVVLGVKVDSVVGSGENCSEDDTDCEVATATFDLIHTNGSSSDDAKQQFLGKLENHLGDGVQLQAVTSPQVDDSHSTPISSIETDSSNEGKSDSPSNLGNPIETGSSGEGLSAPIVAMVSVLSVAAVAIVLVLVQRKLTMTKRDDDKSVDGSMMTCPTTAHFSLS